MNLHKFISNYHTYFNTTDVDNELSTIKVLVGGLSPTRTARLINAAVKLMTKDEMYLEIGTFSGFTLAAAALHNEPFPCIGVDDLSFQGFGFDSTDKVKEDARKKISYAINLSNSTNAKFLESDFRKVDIDKDWKIGVFYVDGYHTAEEVYENLEWGHSRLSDNALILVDDISIGNVGAGVKKWVDEHSPQYHEFFHMDSLGIPGYDRSIEEPTFIDGLSMLWYCKDQTKKPMSEQTC